MCASLCDESGNLLLSCTKENYISLYQGGARAIEEIFDHILDLNGLNKKDEEESIENFTMPDE